MATPVIQGILPPRLDPQRGMRMYTYTDFVESQIKEFSDPKNHKNVADLFNPKSPDFLGSPEILKSYAPDTKELIDDPKGLLTPVAPADYSKLPENDFIAQVKSGKIPYDKGVEEAVRRGLLVIKPPPIPAAPSLGAPVR